MNITEELKTEIKNRVRPSDIIGKRVKLRRNGREFVGLSPFTNEKTASFTVNDEKGFYHCFSSGRHGDIFSFIMDFENLPFPQAVNLICEEYGISFDDNKPYKQSNQTRDMYSCVKDASEFFQKQLFSDVGSEARTYLRSRGLNKESVSRFDIGYSPNSFDETVLHLKGLGYSEGTIVDCGLAIIDDNGKIRSKFKNRVMFPIKDNISRPVAFGGRSLNAEKEAKYINSRETKIFRKREILYNISNARKHVSDKNPMIIVEGYLDVITLSMAGFEACVSPMGTSVTDEHIGMVWKLCKEPVMCMDGDRAGRQASYRIVKNILPTVSHNRSANFMFLPDNLDPDDYISKHGVESFDSHLNNPTSMVDFIWQKEKDMIPLDTPERKSDLRSRIFSTTEEIENKNVKYYYRRELLSRFDAEIKDSWKIKNTYLKPCVGIITDSINIHEKNLSCLPVLFPNISGVTKEFLSSASFININAENIRSIYLKCLDNNDYENIDECVIMNIDESDLKYVNEFKAGILKAEDDKPLTDEAIIDIWNFSKDRYKEAIK